MCYADPIKSLELARARMAPGAWSKFEADFEHFVAYSGLGYVGYSGSQELHFAAYAWAKWAFFKGQGL